MTMTSINIRVAIPVAKYSRALSGPALATSPRSHLTPKTKHRTYSDDYTVCCLPSHGVAGMAVAQAERFR